jgi:hypothetical protein
MRLVCVCRFTCGGIHKNERKAARISLSNSSVSFTLLTHHSNIMSH